MPYHEQHLWDVILPRFLIELTVHVTVIRVTIGQTSPLDEAVVNGHDRVVRFLLQTGFKPDYQTRTKSTMLALAAANGYLDVVKSLLEFHRGLYAGYLSNGNALAAAAENPQEVCLSSCSVNHCAISVEGMVRARQGTSTGTWGALEKAMKARKCCAVEILAEELIAGSLDRYLFDAIHSERAEVLQVLLGNGADPNAAT
ncbi:hypothetical protein BDV06DRAFT_222764 [Aspergillus oleicola]